MEALDWLRIGLRWTHAVAALVWVGGGLFWWLAVRPAQAEAGTGHPGLVRAIGEHFGQAVSLSVPVLLLTGMVLAADRLTAAAAGLLYATLLGLKVALAVAMIWLNRDLALRRRVSGGPARLNRPALLLGLGLAVYLLADALKVVFEAGLIV